MARYIVYGLSKETRTVEDAISILRSNGFRGDDIAVLFPENIDTKPFLKDQETEESALSWLAGLGALVPGIGPFIGAMSWGMLFGRGAGEKPGSLGEALAHMGIPPSDMNHYEQRFKEGAIVVSAYCEDFDWVMRARKSYTEAGIEDIGFFREETPEAIERRTAHA